MSNVIKKSTFIAELYKKKHCPNKIKNVIQEGKSKDIKQFV
jgi:hypothetical protein